MSDRIASPAKRSAVAGRPMAASLQRQCACGTHVRGSRECPACEKRQQNVQRKLTIGARADPLEFEADRAADQVLSPQGAAIDASRSERVIRMSPASLAIHSPSAPQVPASVERALSGAGMPLVPVLRQEMEQRFGHDFSNVRVHTDASAEQAAREIQASAYTVGPHVVFGAGRFAPASREGRHLLAHELAHVVQQRGIAPVVIQRQPLDDAGTVAPEVAGATATPDADAIPADATGATPTAAPAAAPVMPTRIPSNESEAIEDTDKAYPTDADVGGAIASVAEPVRKALGTDIAYHRKFLARTSLYLGPHPNPVNHFSKIQEFPDGSGLFLHERTLVRLEQVRAQLKAKGKPMPKSGTGFSFRELIRQPTVPFPGLMVHALGYAIDYRAATNPHVKDTRLVAIQAIYKEEATAFRVATGPWTDRRATVKKMGQGTATPQEEQAFITRLQEEGAKAVAGSLRLTNEIPPQELAELRSFREPYKKILAEKRSLARRLEALKKPLKKSGMSLGAGMQIAALVAEQMDIEARRKPIVDRTRAIFGKVISKTDAQIKRMRALPNVATTEKEYAATLETLSAAFTKAKRAVESADRDLRTTSAAFERSKRKLSDLDARIGAEKNPTRRARFEQQRPAAQTAQIEADQARKESGVRWGASRLGKWNAEAELGAAKAAAGSRRWLAQLEDLQHSLSVEGFDARLVFGIGAGTEAETDKAVSDPSLIQLFSRGFFNVDPAPQPSAAPAPSTPAPTTATTKGASKPPPAKPQGFDLTFMEEMSRHGFDQGSEWEPTSVDSMHFELAEEVDKLAKPTDAVLKARRKVKSK